MAAPGVSVADQLLAEIAAAQAEQLLQQQLASGAFTGRSGKGSAKDGATTTPRPTTPNKGTAAGPAGKKGAAPPPEPAPIHRDPVKMQERVAALEGLLERLSAQDTAAARDGRKAVRAELALARRNLMCASGAPDHLFNAGTALLGEFNAVLLARAGVVTKEAAGHREQALIPGAWVSLFVMHVSLAQPAVASFRVQVAGLSHAANSRLTLVHNASGAVVDSLPLTVPATELSAGEYTLWCDCLPSVALPVSWLLTAQASAAGGMTLTEADRDTLPAALEVRGAVPKRHEAVGLALDQVLATSGAGLVSFSVRAVPRTVEDDPELAEKRAAALAAEEAALVSKAGGKGGAKKLPEPKRDSAKDAKDKDRGKKSAAGSGAGGSGPGGAGLGGGDAGAAGEPLALVPVAETPEEARSRLEVSPVRISLELHHGGVPVRAGQDSFQGLGSIRVPAILLSAPLVRPESAGGAGASAPNTSRGGKDHLASSKKPAGAAGAASGSGTKSPRGDGAKSPRSARPSSAGSKHAGGVSEPGTARGAYGAAAEDRDAAASRGAFTVRARILGDAALTHTLILSVLTPGHPEEVTLSPNASDLRELEALVVQWAEQSGKAAERIVKAREARNAYLVSRGLPAEDAPLVGQALLAGADGGKGGKGGAADKKKREADASTASSKAGSKKKGTDSEPATPRDPLASTIPPAAPIYVTVRSDAERERALAELMSRASLRDFEAQDLEKHLRGDGEGKVGFGRSTVPEPPARVLQQAQEAHTAWRGEFSAGIAAVRGERDAYRKKIEALIREEEERRNAEDLQAMAKLGIKPKDQKPKKK
jgi:hypothetical protein